jgi:D-inositol-3-phosphate glycosyltransferase
MMTVNGRLASCCLAMGPYLQRVAAGYCPRSEVGLYYGIDVEQFSPTPADARAALRRRHDLPLDRFLIVLSSRISHEKDPETVLRATALARAQGLDAVLLNLGGGYREFLALARSMRLPDVDDWVIGRPAVHPMTEMPDFFRAADAAALASLAEGAAFSTLEALACGTPLVATAVGGMAVQLEGFARLTPRRDATAMARELLWIAGHPAQARAQALAGRQHVCEHWSRARAFDDLRRVLHRVAGRPVPDFAYAGSGSAQE